MDRDADCTEHYSVTAQCSLGRCLPADICSSRKGDRMTTCNAKLAHVQAECAHAPQGDEHLGSLAVQCDELGHM